MMDFLFFVKTLALCLVITLLMQIKVDQFTIEHHAQKFIQTSAAMMPLQTVAQGGAKAFRDLTKSISSAVHKNGKGKKEKEEAKESKSSFMWQSHTPSQNETESDLE